MQQNERRLRLYLAAVLISLVLPSVASAATRGEPASGDAVSSLSAIRIDNFGRVNSMYYRGAQPKGQDYADLAALGVRTVIDLTKDGDPAEAGMAERVGMKFFRLAMTTRETPSPDTITKFLQIVNDPANQPVFVHCQGGRHRTGVMTAVYRMTNDGWTADRAFAEMKQYGFGADFLHPEFKQFVYGFHAPIVRVDAAGARSAGTLAAKATGTRSAADAKEPPRR